MTKTIHVERETTAPARRVWEALDDSPGWVQWTPIDECTVQVPRTPTQHEVRAVRNGGVRLTEEIVDRDPGRELSYTVLSGLAVTNYRATVSLHDTAGGTRIVWHTEFGAKVPGTGWIYAAALTRATVQFVDGLVRHCELSEP